MRTLTPQQTLAIAATGDVLVMAGAGAGKTSTLVDRILDRVLKASPRLPLDRILVVTFNEAAAAEMRFRLRRRFEGLRCASPGDPWIEEQSALLETAHVSTLHAFCLRLIREHFHELDLDPQFAVQDAVQTRLQREEVLDALLTRHYAGTAPESNRVRTFLERHASDGDEQVRRLVLRVHDYARSLPDSNAWLRAQRTGAEATSPEAWRQGVGDGFRSWAGDWRDHVQGVASATPENFAAAESASALGLSLDHGGMELALVDALITAGDESRFAKGQPGFRKKGIWREPLVSLFNEAAELRAYVLPAKPGGVDPLTEDWGWARGDVLALIELVEQFGRDVEAGRRATAVLDFADLEQLALRLLWDTEGGRPTPLAQRWRERFEQVLVDEYQDINPAQDRIVACLSRDDGGGNRFLVGDVKQSIYRFRRADPRVFQTYAREWRGVPPHQVIPLSENFRSHVAILDFVNGLFERLMRPEVGGVAYDAEARLVFGAPELRSVLREKPEGRVELHLLVSGSEERDSADESDSNGPEAGESAGEVEVRDLDAEEKQAAIAAARLRDLHDRKEPIWDAGLGAPRPMAWKDAVILHPAPGPVAERWARQFASAGIPIEARRSGFFGALEVSDLVNLARLLDNPLQDLPALTVLRSPLVGLTVDELAAVRLAQRRGNFWAAVETLVGRRGDGSEGQVDPALRAASASARAKLGWFLERFRIWRRLAREISVARCLETVLAETAYEAWLRAQPRAEALLANVRKLLDLVRQFDQFQRAGLFRFLRFVEAQTASDQDLDAAPAVDSDCVRLLSIHQSKGLEFPVVVFAALGRAFNLGDLHGEWLIDEEFGICPPVLPPNRMRGYASLPRWFAKQRQRREFSGEQIRLCYVACTRAIERLILIGAASQSRLESWNSPDVRLSSRELIGANNPLAWIGPQVPRLTGNPNWHQSGQGTGHWMDWKLHLAPPAVVAPATPTIPGAIQASAETVTALRARLEWEYPWRAAVKEPAKAAVTTLRRRWSVVDENDARIVDPEDPRSATQPRGSAPVSREAVARGEAHHLFFECVDVSKSASLEGLQAERERLLRDDWLSEEHAALLDLEGIAAFWSSPLGTEIRSRPECVQREVPFTASLRPREAAMLGATGGTAGFSEDDLQVIQGVVDLMFVLPDEIWLVDYKTDRLAPEQVEERAAKYRVQLLLYAHALSAIHRRPVTRRCLWFVSARRLVELGID